MFIILLCFQKFVFSCCCDTFLFQMILMAEEVRTNMEKLGLFKRIKVFVDTAKGDDARPDGYEVTYTVKEPRVLNGGISTLVGTNDGSLVSFSSSFIGPRG